MLSTLLATKLYRPRPTSTLVARPRLTKRLDRGLQDGHPLILVVAPAGYGKTTLVSRWLGDLGVPSAWLLLDEGDNDPFRYFTYVVAALQTLHPQVGHSLLETLRTLPQSPEVLVHPLINDLAGVNQPILLVLDDYHLITDAFIQEAMAILLDRAPPNLHLVVLTRADPPFPLPRLRVRGQITEIRGADLRFTPEEMAAFLNSVHGLNLAAEQITALELRTEGWVAGVQLAALSLQGQGPERAAQFVQAFSGSHRYIIDYLGDEVLRRQPDEVQSFLLQTSILDRLCGPLCDAVLGGGTDSDRMLVELERKSLFLIPLDDERRWYRYHHLFSDLLLQRLKQTQAHRLSELYVRAALWFEQKGYLEDGVGFALKAQDYELAIRLMEQVKYPVATRGDLHMIIHWLETLPEDLLRSLPEWCFGYASMLTLTGYFEAAERWLGLMENGFAPLAPSDRHAAARLAKVPVYRSVFARFRGDLRAAVALAQSGLDQTATTEAHDMAVALLFLGQAHFHAGNTKAAEQVLADAMQWGLASGHLTAYLNACHHLAQLRVLQARLLDAKALCGQAIRVAGEQARPVYAGVEHAGLGDLEREWNHLEVAAAEIEKGLELAKVGDDIFFLTDVCLLRVRLALAQRDWECAWSCLTRAEQVARRSTTSLAVENLRSWHARIHLAQGDLAQAEQWAAAKKAGDGGPFDPQQEFDLLTLARVWLALGQAEQAGALLERIRTGAEKAGRHGRALEAQMLEALADQAAGKESRAMGRLGLVLARAEPEGYVRLFVDEGEPMARLLQRAVGRGITPVYSSKLLAAMELDREGERRQPAAGAGTPLVESLSERELEVLHLVSAGLSNREIAERLIVSVSTVKKHVQNIHGKLGVKSRTAAVARGRELNLL